MWWILESFPAYKRLSIDTSSEFDLQTSHMLLTVNEALPTKLY